MKYYDYYDFDDEVNIMKRLYLQNKQQLTILKKDVNDLKRENINLTNQIQKLGKTTEDTILKRKIERAIQTNQNTIGYKEKNLKQIETSIKNALNVAKKRLEKKLAEKDEKLVTSETNVKVVEKLLQKCQEQIQEIETKDDMEMAPAIKEAMLIGLKDQEEKYKNTYEEFCKKSELILEEKKEISALNDTLAMDKLDEFINAWDNAEKPEPPVSTPTTPVSTPTTPTSTPTTPVSTPTTPVSTPTTPVSTPTTPVSTPTTPTSTPTTPVSTPTTPVSTPTTPVSTPTTPTSTPTTPVSTPTTPVSTPTTPTSTPTTPVSTPTTPVSTPTTPTSTPTTPENKKDLEIRIGKNLTVIHYTKTGYEEKEIPIEYYKDSLNYTPDQIYGELCEKIKIDPNKDNKDNKEIREISEKVNPIVWEALRTVDTEYLANYIDRLLDNDVEKSKIDIIYDENDYENRSIWDKIKSFRFFDKALSKKEIEKIEKYEYIDVNRRKIARIIPKRDKKAKQIDSTKDPVKNNGRSEFIKRLEKIEKISDDPDKLKDSSTIERENKIKKKIENEKSDDYLNLF